jgi:hypothetical protein
MTNIEWIDMIRLIPEAEHGKLVIVLQNGTELCVDTIIRYDDAFVCMRGRIAGQVEEARGFFVPYDQMLCLRWDRLMKVEELEALFGNAAASKTDELERPAIPAADQASPAAPTDAAAASRLLLEKIKAARAASSPAKFPTTM